MQVSSTIGKPRSVSCPNTYGCQVTLPHFTAHTTACTAIDQQRDQHAGGDDGSADCEASRLDMSHDSRLASVTKRMPSLQQVGGLLLLKRLSQAVDSAKPNTERVKLDD